MTDPRDALDQDLEPIIMAVTRADRDCAIRLAVAAFMRGQDHPLVRLLVAEGLEADGRTDEAIDLLQKVAAEAPEEAEGWRRLGDLLARQGRLEEALAALKRALDIDPDMYLTLALAGAVSFRLADMDRAEGHYRRAARLAPNEAEPLGALAAIAARRGDAETARDLGQRALAQGPSLSAQMALARADVLQGRFQAAEDRMSRLLERRDLDPDARVGLLDLRAETRDALNRPADAFADYSARNRLIEAGVAPRIERELAERKVEQVLRLCHYFSNTPKEPWRTAPPPDPTEPAHVFLVGFPRSGTTLLEKALAGHPDIVTLEETDHLDRAAGHWLAGAAELDHLARLSAAEADLCRKDYWDGVRAQRGEAASSKVIVDKMPLHSIALPLVAKLFPRAKILFAIRDPRDVVLSCFRRRFQINAAMYEFLNLSRAAHFYCQVMDLVQIYRNLLPLQILDVRHERVVADFDDELRTILRFIGCDWDPCVRTFAERTGSALRTPSDPQLARGLNADGVDQWRRYAGQMAPVLAQLDPWVRHFGYSASPRQWGYKAQILTPTPPRPIPTSPPKS